ncbi:carboxypeptidase-like regulatory domain-containing protein [Planctomycetota bacterium]
MSTTTIRLTTVTLTIALVLCGCGARVRVVHDDWQDKVRNGRAIVDLMGVCKRKGQRVPNVKVRFIHLASRTVTMVYTRASEATIVKGLIPGRYELKVSGRPLGTSSQKRTFEIAAGQTVRVLLYDHGDDWKEAASTAGCVVLAIAVAPSRSCTPSGESRGVTTRGTRRRPCSRTSSNGVGHAIWLSVTRSLGRTGLTDGRSGSC